VWYRVLIISGQQFLKCCRTEKDDKLKGYGLGADDYITKPFEEEELLWKIKAVIQRIPENKSESRNEVILLGKYTFDFTNQSLTIDGKTKGLQRGKVILLSTYPTIGII